MLKKIIIIGLFFVIIGGAIFFLTMKLSASKDVDIKTIACNRGSIVDKALAVGTIVPREEIAVKSNISGIVKKLYIDVGDKVHVGDPLIDISPDPTPLEYAEAKRQVEISEVTYENAQREYNRLQTLLDKNLIAAQECESAKAKCDETRLRLNLARERLALIDKGETKVAGRIVENVIKASIAGTILTRNVNVGDPVVPLTSYQSGTDLLVMADMSNLLFKGTVDEIDVGKLRTGMPVEVQVGALPNEKIAGVLTKVSPKAHQDQGATVFNVEIELTDIGDVPLRAGYSANADIIIVKKEDILLIPERLVEFVNDSAYVNVNDSLGGPKKTPIVTGLSDGINIEVVDGLTEGQLVVELPPKEIK